MIMNLPKVIQDFFESSPVSLVAGSGGPLSVSEIKIFYEQEIASQVKDQTFGQLTYAGLLMAQDYIWEAHEIVQDYPVMESSWWHAFMHRMEGDYSNADYWYRRVGQPSLYVDLQRVVKGTCAAAELSSLQADWDPFLFNNLIPKYIKTSCKSSLEQIHRKEWEILFAACLQKAIN